MTIPTGAIKWQYVADPTDVVEYVAQFAETGPNGEPPLLEAEETISTMVPTMISTALGGTILEGEVGGIDRGPWIADDVNGLVWVTIAEENRADPAFDEGASIAIAFTITTSLGRTFQVTFYFTAKQK